MSKRKKKKTTPTTGGYKQFMKNIYETIHEIGIYDDTICFSNTIKHRMYEARIRFQHPQKANNLVSKKEIEQIDKLNKIYFREKTLQMNDSMLSCEQLFWLYTYVSGWEELITKHQRYYKLPEVIEGMKKLMDTTFKNLMQLYIVNFFKVVSSLSSPDKKYYGLKISPAAIVKEMPRFEIQSEVHVISPRRRYFKIGENKRIAFHLAKPFASKSKIEWITIETSLLKNAYTGKLEKLDVYIQTHALKRLAERLDLLDSNGVNYSIWRNTSTIAELKFYRNYILLPFKLYDVVVGYLLANVVEDCLLFRTFLFITHNCTPEGDRLKQQTGLKKEDMKYWKIDRLSTFVNLNEKKYSGTVSLFKNAGLDELFNLKDKSFNVNKMQEANLDSFIDYMTKSGVFREFNAKI